MTQESLLLARAFGRLDGALAAFGNADQLGPMLRRAEVVASSRIDGNQASLIDLLDAEAGLTVTGPARDAAELRALSDLAGRLPNGTFPGRAGCSRFMANWRRRLGQPGVGWRTAPLWIGPSGSTRAEARHIPPSPEQVPGLMLEWEQSWQKSADIDPLVKLSSSLAALESIHPFTELNARVARLWLQQALIQLGLHPQSQPSLVRSTPAPQTRGATGHPGAARRKTMIRGPGCSLPCCARPRTKPPRLSAGLLRCVPRTGK